MIITRLTGLCAALAICTTLATSAGAQTANPFKKPPPAEAAATAATDKAKTVPATKPSATEAVAEKKPPSQAQLASRARMKECGADWQEMKAAGKTKGMTWRQFSGDCLKKKSM